MLQTKVDISNCCSLCTNRCKTHLRESVISKFFSGGCTPGPPFSTGGEGRGKERMGMCTVRREGTGKRTGEEGKGSEMGRGYEKGRGRKGEKKKKRGGDVWPPPEGFPGYATESKKWFETFLIYVPLSAEHLRKFEYTFKNVKIFSEC
jgi:hypothetical protein